jgi:hypothetical protein
MKPERYERPREAILSTVFGPQRVRVYGFSRMGHYVVDDPFLSGVFVYADEDELLVVQGRLVFDDCVAWGKL